MNAKFKNFISKLSANVTKNIEVTETKLKIPANIDLNKYEKTFSEEITSNILTDEKALYVAFIGRSKKTEDAKTILFNHMFIVK